jgi:predicted cation transporter
MRMISRSRKTSSEFLVPTSKVAAMMTNVMTDAVTTAAMIGTRTTVTAIMTIMTDVVISGTMTRGGRATTVKKIAPSTP